MRDETPDVAADTLIWRPTVPQNLEKAGAIHLLGSMRVQEVEPLRFRAVWINKDIRIAFTGDEWRTCLFVQKRNSAEYFPVSCLDGRQLHILDWIALSRKHEQMRRPAEPPDRARADAIADRAPSLFNRPSAPPRITGAKPQRPAQGK